MSEVDPNTLYPDVLGGFKSTPPEYAQNILDHVRIVAKLVNRCAAELVERGTDHDRSKWTPEEYGLALGIVQGEKLIYAQTLAPATSKRTSQ